MAMKGFSQLQWGRGMGKMDKHTKKPIEFLALISDKILAVSFALALVKIRVSF